MGCLSLTQGALLVAFPLPKTFSLDFSLSHVLLGAPPLHVSWLQLTQHTPLAIFGKWVLFPRLSAPYWVSLLAYLSPPPH
jgi:hypothetical protein